MKTLVVGLGNPILGDDGAGWKVVEQVSRQVAPHSTAVETDCLAVGGLTLMERIIGYERVILVDAIRTGQHPPGTIHRFRVEELPPQSAGHTASAHDVGLHTALGLAASLGVATPREIIIVAIEAEKVFDFSEELTPPVAAALPLAVQTVMKILNLQEANP